MTMKRTESLYNLTHDPYLDGKETKKRSYRSRSKPRSARSQNPRQRFGHSPTIERLLSVDSTFEEFDTAKYEGEVESYKSAKINDFQGIVSGRYTTNRRKNTLPRRNSSPVKTLQVPQTRVATTQSSARSLASISTSPFGEDDYYCDCNSDIDDNNNDPDDPEAVSEPEETLDLNILTSSRNRPNPEITQLQQQSDSAIRPKKAELDSSDYDESFSNLATAHVRPRNSYECPSTSTVATVMEKNLEDTSNQVDLPPDTPTTIAPRPPSMEAFPFSLKEIDEWESAFTRNYKEQQRMIENSDKFTPRQKLQLIKSHHTSWILDLYEQLDRFSEVVEDFQKATDADRKKFLGTVFQLEDKLHEAQRQVAHEKGKVESLETENFRQLKVIENLQEIISNLKLADAEKIRDVSDRVIQRYVLDTSEIDREQEKLLSVIEHHKARIERKSKRVQQLNVEQQAARLKLRATASEESRLRSEMNQIRSTPEGRRTSEHFTEMGALDTDEEDKDKALNDLWRNISSGADIDDD